MQEKKWVYTIYTIFDTKNRNIEYLFLDIRLYTVKELKILQKYMDLKNIFNKKAI